MTTEKIASNQRKSLSTSQRRTTRVHAALVTLDAHAKSLAREVFKTESDKHHGVRYLKGQALALVFHNEPPEEDPAERFDEIQKFRDWLNECGYLVVTAAGYPSQGMNTEHTTVFLVRARKADIAPIQGAMDRLFLTPKQRAFCRELLCSSETRPTNAAELLWNAHSN